MNTPSVLTTYHDCDRLAVVIAVVLFWAIMFAIACTEEKRRKFARYEQQRRKYSEWRLDEIRHGRM